MNLGSFGGFGDLFGGIFKIGDQVFNSMAEANAYLQSLKDKAAAELAQKQKDAANEVKKLEKFGYNPYIEKYYSDAFNQIFSKKHYCTVQSMPLVPTHGNETIHGIHIIAGTVKGLRRGIRIAPSILQRIIHDSFQRTIPHIQFYFQPPGIAVILVAVLPVFDLVIGRYNFSTEQIINISIKKSYIKAQAAGQLLPETKFISNSFFRL